MWPLGKASKVVDQSGRQAYKFTVTARGPFGPVPALTYIVDMTNWWGSLDMPAGSLHQLTLAVKGLGEMIKASKPYRTKRAAFKVSSELCL